MLIPFTNKELRFYDRLLYVYLDTKRVKAIEFLNKKKKILLNKEREVRRTKAGGFAQAKYQKHVDSLIKETLNWQKNQLNRLQLDNKYDKIKIEAKNKEQREQAELILKNREIGREWYERFRWKKFKNALLIAGKSKESNEELLQRYKENEDLVFHTEERGSPFVLVKGEVNKEVIRKAAIMTAYYSKDWRDNRRDVLVRYTKGKDVIKEKNMDIGTFRFRDSSLILIRKEEII